MSAEAQFRTQVRMVVADEADIGQLSTGERIAVAFVLNRPDLLEQYWGSMLEFRRSSRHRPGLAPPCASSATAVSLHDPP